MQAPALDCHVADGIATLTMNRPEARNALSMEMKDAFSAALRTITHDPSIRAVVLTGANQTFCAGGDLRSMVEVRDQMTVEMWRDRMRELGPWVRQLIELDRPVIAAVDGAAYGAGFSLALMADFVLATPQARFCLSFMKVGLVPDCAAAYTLPRIVGVQRAKELMLSAREVAADEAQRLGIVMEIVESEQLMPRAQALARSFTGASPLATSLIKRGVNRSLTSDVQEMLDMEAEHQALCFMTGYHREAVDRFLGKQPAMFGWPKADGG